MAPVPFRCNQNLYNQYYNAQTGSGSSYPVFQGDLYQHGYGIGGLLSGLFRNIIPTIGRVVKPLIRSGGKALVKSAVRMGKNVAKDVIRGKSLKKVLRDNAKEELKQLGKQGVSHLFNQFSTKKPAQQKQRGKRKIPIKNPKKNSKKRKRDIFDKH